MPSTQLLSQGAGQILPVNSGEIIGGAEDFVCVFPLLAVNGVIEFGDDIAEGAAVMTEGDAAIHASCRLLVEFLG